MAYSHVVLEAVSVPELLTLGIFGSGAAWLVVELPTLRLALTQAAGGMFVRLTSLGSIAGMSVVSLAYLMPYSAPVP